MTDSEKLDDIQIRLKRVEAHSHIHLAIILIGFFGFITIEEIVRHFKK